MIMHGQECGRPVLEMVRHPLFDTILFPDDLIENGPDRGQLHFWTYPVGAHVPDRGVKTFRETNLRRAGYLSVPQHFDFERVLILPDLRGFGARYLGAVKEAVDEVRRAAQFLLELGQKSYLRVPAEVVMSSLSLEDEPGEAPKDRAAPYVPERVAPLDQGFRVALALRPGEARDDVYLHISSEQQVTPQLVFDDGVPKIPFKLKLRLYLVGNLYREVQ